MAAFPVLGHILQSDGGVRSCWLNTKACMWRAFFSNLNSTTARDLPRDLRIKLLNRACRPSFDYRCSRWPPQRQIAIEVDSFQRKLVAAAVRLPQRPGEAVEEFCRRRGHHAGQLCKELGLWSKRWFERAFKWDAFAKRSEFRELVRQASESPW